MFNNRTSKREHARDRGGRPMIYLMLLMLVLGLLLPGISAAEQRRGYSSYRGRSNWNQRGGSMSQRLVPKTRQYDVMAIDMPLVVNNWGDYDPAGAMFALKKNAKELLTYRQDLQALIAQNSSDLPTHPLVSPLVLRCNQGDKMHVKFTNLVNGRQVGMHPYLFGYDITNDGTVVGDNQASIVSTNEETEYEWPCLKEGTYLISDGGNYDGFPTGTVVHGLFAAIIVEPRGSLWTDPVTGKPTEEGTHVDIHPYPMHGGCPEVENFYAEERMHSHPDCSFREFTLFFQDRVQMVNNGPPTIDPCTGNNSTGSTLIENFFNYRSEPMKNRELALWRMINEGTISNVNGEEQHHSSWLFGDPATPVFRAYAGDPVRFRVIETGVTETHVFHLHGHQWSSGRGDRKSDIIDSFSLSPLTTWDLDIHFGAGSRLKLIGDVILHCHLYVHFETGMWSMMRVLDRYEDGRYTYPDGSPIPKLTPLPGRPHPPYKSEIQPGFPNFIAGTPGQKSPRVPWPEEILGKVPEGSDYRPATKVEVANMNSDPQPGNFFTLIPTPREVDTHFFNVSIQSRQLEYNKHGWYYPYGHMYQAEEQVKPDPGRPAKYEPFAMRVTQKSVSVSQYNNHLPEFIPGTVFDPDFPRCKAVAHEGEAGMHVHLVKFDVLSSDGASVGWNYISGARFGKYLINRWWIDDALGHVFFHDHLFASYRQKKGLYGLAPVAPEGSKFLNPRDVKTEQRYNVSAVVVGPEESFREQVLFIGDFAPAFYSNGTAINPPPAQSPFPEQGIVLLNYRNEPLSERKGLDPSEWFSSKNKYGDPSTTLFEAYRGDNIIIRLAQGAHDKSHSLEMHGMRWQKFRDLANVNVTAQQTIGISEGFTFRVQADYSAGDHLYKLGGVDDLWLGNWGIVRVHDSPQKHLPPIPDSQERRSSFYHSPLLKSIARYRYAHTRQSKGVGKSLTRAASKFRSKVTGERQYFVTAKRQEIVYNSDGWSDPFGLIYCLTGYQHPHTTKIIKPKNGECFNVNGKDVDPLIIRGLVGERVLIHLHNALPKQLEPEPFPVPVTADIPDRKVSSRVSMHVPLIQHDVRYDDGTNVGYNPDSTVGPGKTISYSLYADQHLGALPIQDHADIRNHKHHGLIGALVILDSHQTPDKWYGAEANVYYRNNVYGKSENRRRLLYQDKVVLLQSGLRLFQNNQVNQPIPYAVNSPVQILANLTTPVPNESTISLQDTGLKAMSYRNQPAAAPNWLKNNNPSTHIFHAQAGVKQLLHVVSGLDKPRPLSFHLHGHAWEDQLKAPQHGVSSVNNAISTGTSITNEFYASNYTGDWAYRPGWINTEFLLDSWGIFRVQK
ncbi:hypothetical protein K493DRAFT_380874 [Basidiobolus meristosporus CBS 931.73]|uniref:Cupredoxin n=1 Tax=Basidiobolus meristosporus CBS 931.73 TaxID=1314790 RepID=A0A1Y1XX47_9FUNG|nr:hypothetical protein K493DRAFT_380874 [Basidiobolus meristosporus CBS 931.73]|eukprot:ORX90320.1 hypothetical protein K493DRAFT_380874 [Basidiobolus meristosporus CBS 931.73]